MPLLIAFLLVQNIAISGTLKDADGKPLTGVRVAAMPLAGTWLGFDMYAREKAKGAAARASERCSFDGAIRWIAPILEELYERLLGCSLLMDCCCGFSDSTLQNKLVQ